MLVSKSEYNRVCEELAEVKAELAVANKRIYGFIQARELRNSDRIYTNRLAITKFLKDVDHEVFEHDNNLQINAFSFEWAVSLKTCRWSRKARKGSANKMPRVSGYESSGISKLITDIKGKQ